MSNQLEQGFDEHAPLRDRVLTAARVMFQENGYVGTKTRELAAAAGTSESGVFRVFDDKYGVLMAVYNDAWKRVNDRIDSVLAENSFADPRETLLEIISVVWRIYEEDPKHAAILIINTGNTDSLLVDHQDQATISDENVLYLNRIEDLCHEAAATGLLSPGLSARSLAEGIYGIAEGVLLGWYLHDEAEPGRMPPKISFDEAISLVRKLLW